MREDKRVLSVIAEMATATPFPGNASTKRDLAYDAQEKAPSANRPEEACPFLQRVAEFFRLNVP